MFTEIQEKIQQNYSPQQYPCLFKQFHYFKNKKPLEGFKIIHCTPLFKNALVKIFPLLASGALVQFWTPPALDHDREIVRLLKKYNFYWGEQSNSAIDLILDCAGSCSHLSPSLGAIELTKSGEAYYQNKNFPVISVDRSPLKTIEDMHGTADGFLRALKKQNIFPPDHSQILLFGYGKVGRGLVHILQDYPLKITIIDRKEVIQKGLDCSTVDCQNKAEIKKMAGQADYIITCTGIKNMIQNHYEIEDFIASKALCINMGAEDEYGDRFPAERVLNHKRPFNFILEEPTRLEFLDPVFALHNYCALYLIDRKIRKQNGIIPPPKYLESKILADSSLKEMI